MSDLISVIVPVFNVADYLEKCVDSILNQSYRDIEVILVDDGSTDGSGDICDRYALADGRVSVVHQENGGISAARNTGLRKCRGRYISFIDSDDYIDLGMLDALYLAAVSNDAGIALCGFISENRCDDKSPGRVSPAIEAVFDGKTVIRTRFFGAEQFYWSVIWNKLFVRELFDNVVFPVNYFHEDLFVLPRLINESNRVACIGASLYHYVQREGSILHSDNGRELDRCVAHMNLADFFSSDRDYSSVIDHLLIRGLSIYKNNYWQNGFSKKTEKMKERKEESERLFRSAWRKYRKFCGLPFKMRLYYNMHCFSPDFLRLLSFIFRRTALYKHFFSSGFVIPKMEV